MEAAVRERLDKAIAAFVDVIEAGVEATLTAEITASPESHWRPNWREGEFDVIVETPSAGIYHEQIAAVLAIAEKHGAHAWLGRPDGKLTLLFELNREPGPEGDTPDRRRPKKKATS